MVAWMHRQLAQHQAGANGTPREEAGPRDGAWVAAEAVDPDFADALRGDAHGRVWNPAAGTNGNGHAPDPGSSGWRWPWERPCTAAPRMVHRMARNGKD
jgi:hypothetical protein